MSGPILRFLSTIPCKRSSHKFRWKSVYAIVSNSARGKLWQLLLPRATTLLANTIRWTQELLIPTSNSCTATTNKRSSMLKLICENQKKLKTCGMSRSPRLRSTRPLILSASTHQVQLWFSQFVTSKRYPVVRSVHCFCTTHPNKLLRLTNYSTCFHTQTIVRLWFIQASVCITYWRRILCNFNSTRSKIKSDTMRKICRW